MIMGKFKDSVRPTLKIYIFDFTWDMFYRDYFEQKSAVPRDYKQVIIS